MSEIASDPTSAEVTVHAIGKDVLLLKEKDAGLPADLSGARYHECDLQGLPAGRALLASAETGATPNRFGLHTPAWPPLNACRNWYPRTFPRLAEIVRQLNDGQHND